MVFHGYSMLSDSPIPHPHLFSTVVRQEDAVALDTLHRHLATGVRLPKLKGTSHPAGPRISVDEGFAAADLILDQNSRQYY